MKKDETLLQGLELTVIGTLVKHPDTFRQVREILRPEMFISEEGAAIAQKVWAIMSEGSWNKNVFAANLTKHEASNVDKASSAADPENLRTAAEMLSAHWADGRYKKTVEEVVVNYSTFTDWREADKALNEAKRDILNMSTGKVKEPAEVIEDIMSDLWDGLLGKKQHSGLTTGFVDLDALTGGWYPGQQVIIGGRPGMGKTRFAVQEAYQAAKAGKAAVYFSLEIGKEMIYRYFISYMTNIEVRKMKTYNLTKNEADEIAKAAEMLKEMPLFVVDDVFSVEDILFAAQEIAEQRDVGLIVVDYLQLIGKGQRGRDENRNNELSSISRVCKQLARQTNSTTLVLSQLSRRVEDRPGKRPQLSDLRDSGAIEADADIVLFPFHPSYYDEESDAPDELIVGKHRDGELASIQTTWKNPGFYYPYEEEIFPPFDPSLNGEMKPQAVSDGQDIPF